MKRKILPITGYGGNAFHVPGHSINTDIITPADLLKCLSFDELGPDVFRDARAQAPEAGEVHPFDMPKNKGHSVLVVDDDFGSGSSREHAPAALKHWGIQAIVGLSFANIFRNNCRTNGIICVDVAPEVHAVVLKELASGNRVVDIDLEAMNILIGIDPDDHLMPITMPETDRDMFLRGTWDSIVELLEGKPEVDRVLASLPYIQLVA